MSSQPAPLFRIPNPKQPEVKLTAPYVEIKRDYTSYVIPEGPAYMQPVFTHDAGIDTRQVARTVQTTRI